MDGERMMVRNSRFLVLIDAKARKIGKKEAGMNCGEYSRKSGGKSTQELEEQMDGPKQTEDERLKYEWKKKRKRKNLIIRKMNECRNDNNRDILKQAC